MFLQSLFFCIFNYKDSGQKVNIKTVKTLTCDFYSFIKCEKGHFSA